MAERLRVLVVGASIAGPATAYWLAKAGAHMTVIERYPGIRKGEHHRHESLGSRAHD